MSRRIGTTLRPTGLYIQYHLGETGLHERGHTDLGGHPGQAAGPAPGTDGQGQRATYEALADRIRAAVLDGRLAVATGLPSERELAAGLSLSRTTVGAAYALLREQGWLDSRRGSGSRLRLPDVRGGPGPRGHRPLGRPGGHPVRRRRHLRLAGRHRLA